MFYQLINVAKDLHLEMVSIYWILLTPILVMLLIFEVLKSTEETGALKDIFRAILISILMLASFDFIINNLGMLGDEIIKKISKDQNVWETLSTLSPPEDLQNSNDSWFSIKGHILYVLGIISYLIAYLGFFAAEALTHFVWICLYIISPLMILAYIPKATRRVTGNLYGGLVKVIIWKILWTILSVLLLKLSTSPPPTGLEDYLMAIVMNLSIGVSMLLIPIASKSLIDGAFETTASMVAAAPAYAASAGIKTGMKNSARSTYQKSKEAIKFGARPLTNPIDTKVKQAKRKVMPKINAAKNYYKNINSPKQKEKQND